MIAIIDYGMGNLHSVQKGFERAGFHAELTREASKIACARGVVLPGVGAFPAGMGFRGSTRRLAMPYRRGLGPYVRRHRPCVGGEDVRQGDEVKR